MKKYYAERHGLLTKQLQIDFDELLQYFGCLLYTSDAADE